jgi:hypothetical protein
MRDAMTHPIFPARTHWLLAAALASLAPCAVSVAQAQTPAPATSPKAFGASVSAAKAQSAALAKQAADKAARAQKALTDTDTAKTKLAAAAPTPTQKDALLALEQQIAKLKEQVDKFGKIQAELTMLDAQVAAVAAEPACASDTKGVKLKLAAAKRTIDGVIGSSTSEIAVAKTEEKAQTAPKMKQLLAGYARDVQAVATGANAMATALTKLADQAAKLAACP